MDAPKRFPWMRVGVIVVWVVLLLCGYWWMREHHIAFRHLPNYLRHVTRHMGGWGVLFLLFLYAIRTFFLVPTTILNIVAGTVFGPWLALVINLIGENLSSAIGFGMGRLLGRPIVAKEEEQHSWLRKYDSLLKEKGFFAVLVMRLLFFPFDVVNIGAGMSAISFRTYALATAIGITPTIVAFTLVGKSFNDPDTMIVAAVLIILTLLLTVLLARSEWIKKHVLHKKDEFHS